MRAVAKWLAGGVLAAAQPLRSRFFSCEYQRLNIRRRMCAVAERLSAALATTAFDRFLPCAAGATVVVGDVAVEVVDLVEGF